MVIRAIDIKLLQNKVVTETGEQQCDKADY